MNDSLYIILNQYKKEHITKEEAVKLIEDLYRNNKWNIIQCQNEKKQKSRNGARG